jgi:subtilisin family serine protease
MAIITNNRVISCLLRDSPGGKIRSAFPGSDTSFETRSGTSMAAPHVTGAVALYLQRDPTMTPEQVRSALLNDASNGKLLRIFDWFSPNKLLYTGNIN